MAVLEGHRVTEIFTLSGGHVFPIYDACTRANIRIIDVRHEQTAVFAAEASSKLTRRPGVAVLTAGPGVTNGVSAITTAYFNGSPLVVLAGRAPQGRWGAGSLQELDHVPIVSTVTKLAATARDTSEIPGLVSQAVRIALSPHRGPTFVDFPLDVLYGQGEAEVPQVPSRGDVPPEQQELDKAAELLSSAERPVLVAGSDVWWSSAEDQLVRCVEHMRVPAFANGQGRGCLPADHELFFSRTRDMWKEADVVCVVGAPLDFRLSFGRFGKAQVIHVVDSPFVRAAHASVAASLAGSISATLAHLAERGSGQKREGWIQRLRQLETARRLAEESELGSESTPIHPARVYGELRGRLDRDAVVIGDGGDFVSYAGRFIDSYLPGCWLDPGPFGCLGTGMGYAAAARLAHPDRQVVLLLWDGAAGFSLMDADTLVRHSLPALIVVGNNGIWGLEKHPMQALYGYDVAAELQPACRYDQVVAALGGAGETVTDPSQLGPALDRGLSGDSPYLVNVITDPGISYPRSSNLG